MKHPLHRCALRFPRTSGEAFKDARYATPFEHHTRRRFPAWILCLATVFIWALVIAAGVAFFGRA